jgi:hypothetical protein
MWCGVIGDQLIGPYTFLQYLAGDVYANFFATLTACPLTQHSLTNTPSDVLAA